MKTVPFVAHDGETINSGDTFYCWNGAIVEECVADRLGVAHLPTYFYPDFVYFKSKDKANEYVDSLVKTERYKMPSGRTFNVHTIKLTN